MRKLEGVAALLLPTGLLGLGAAWLGPVGPAPGMATARAPAPALRRPAPKGDADLIQGVWKVVQGRATGKHLGLEVSTQQRWTITAGRIAVEYEDGEKGEATFKLDPAARPPAVVLTFNGEPWRGSTFQ